jgi:UDP-N-acetylmuramate dehydrogenase
MRVMLKREYGRLLSGCTTLKIGGPVFCWLEPGNIDDLFEAVDLARGEGKKITVIGRGSNILARGEGFDGIVMRLGQGFGFINKEDDDIINVGAGLPLSLLVKKTAEWGLTGCEFLAGIPGSFGGALFMNAGVRDAKDPSRTLEVKDLILDAEVLDLMTGKKHVIKKDDMGLTYRSSKLEGKCVISGRLKLKESVGDEIRNRTESFVKTRQWIESLGFPSAGSVFKNPAGPRSAGMLIEQCGLKGARIGCAGISDTHANFIVNLGGAGSDDVMSLIDLAKKKVKERFGIDLELELKLL